MGFHEDGQICSSSIAFSSPDILKNITQFTGNECEVLFRISKISQGQVASCPDALALWLSFSHSTRAFSRLIRVPCVKAWSVTKLKSLVRALFRHGCPFPSTSNAILNLFNWAALHAGGQEVAAGDGTFLDLLFQNLPITLVEKSMLFNSRSLGPILVEACSKGRLGSVKVLLQRMPLPPDPLNMDSALNAACSAGHSAVISFLLEAGVNPMSKQSEALCLAVGNGHVEASHLLLKWGSDPTCRPNLLQLAVQCRRDQPFTSSLESYSSCQGITGIERESLVSLLVGWGARDDRGLALCAAAALGDEGMLEALLPLQMQGHPHDAKASHLPQGTATRRSIEVAGGTLRDTLTLALESSLLNGYFHIATRLLEAGAPVDTHLLQARKRFLDERASTLLLDSFPSNLRDQPQTWLNELLGQAAADSDEAFLRLLLKCGASPVVSDCQALRRAVLHGRAESVRGLVGAAGLTGLRREMPCCTLRAAVQRNFVDVASELLKATEGLSMQSMKHCCSDPGTCAARTLCLASSLDMVDLLMMHGAQQHCANAMRLVACGKAQSWRNEQVAERIFDVLINEEIASRVRQL
jgi:ankyrin repeat protein